MREEEKQKKTIELEYPSNNKTPFVPSLFFYWVFSARVVPLPYFPLRRREVVGGLFFSSSPNND